MLIHGDGVFLFGDVGGGQFGQHIHYQFFIGHVVAKVLLAKTLEALVFSGGKACPGLVNYICECGISCAFLDSVLFPLVGEVFANLDGLEALVDPIVGIAEALEVCERLLDTEFGILHLMDAVCSYLCKPAFEGFGLLGWDGLYDTEKPLDINAFGVMPFAIGGDEFVGGTICPPHERIEFGVAFAKLLEVFAGILAVCEGFHGIDNAEVVLLLAIVPDKFSNFSFPHIQFPVKFVKQT